FGELAKVGVEGTGAYGAGLARHLATEGVEVVEVNRPNRQARRRRGKSDTVDAEAAARAALNGEATVVPKTHGSLVESIRVLRVAFTSARDSRTRVALQIRDLIVTAPDVLRDVLGPLSTAERVARCVRFQVTGDVAAILLSAAGLPGSRSSNAGSHTIPRSPDATWPGSSHTAKTSRRPSASSRLDSDRSITPTWIGGFAASAPLSHG
ncbi:MAG: IS110 family transposase, partial [Acidimicrobiales bacterium]